MEQIYEDLCRLCLKSKNILQSMSINKDAISVVDKIEICTGVNVSENDGLPRNICMQCSSNLEESYNFKKMCENSDKILQAMHKPFLKLAYKEEDTQDRDDKLNLLHLLEQISDLYDVSRSSDLIKRAIDFVNDLQINFQSVHTNVCNKNEANSNNSEELFTTEIDNKASVLPATERSIKNNNVTVADVPESFNKNNSLVIVVRHRYKAEPNNKTTKTRKRFTMLPPYNCPNCKHTFNSYEKLMQHRHNMHSRKYACIYCNKTFRTSSAKKDHIEMHSVAGDTIKCNICNKTCASQKSLRAHRLIHTGALKANCQICHRVFSSPANMRRHMMIHLNQRPHMCHFCGMSFNQASSRDSHIMAKHSPEKIHRCKMCTMRFETTDLLQKHMSRHELQLEDGGSGNYLMTPTCKECNKSFATQSNLKNHMNWHSKPFLCIVCGKGYASKHALKNHERNHTGERPFACTYCDKTFTVKGLLTSHLKSHEGNDGKKFQCNYCSKKFALQSTLTSHIYTHTGERPFKCSVCEKTFNQKAHLRTHKFIHTGEKRHVCEICNRAFALKEGLRYHIMTHTGETPFTCTQCGRGFYIPYKLKVHMLKAHNVEPKPEIKS